MKEIYKVKTPERIVFGDPMYFEQCTKEELKLCIELIYFNNVNTVSITGAFCYKEQYGQTYTYDKDGNVISAVDLAKTSSTFAYYGNQMAKMLNPSGSKYLYDYNDKKQLTTAISTDGQQIRVRKSSSLSLSNRSAVRRIS